MDHKWNLSRLLQGNSASSSTKADHTPSTVKRTPSLNHHLDNLSRPSPEKAARYKSDSNFPPPGSDHVTISNVTQIGESEWQNLPRPRGPQISVGPEMNPDIRNLLQTILRENRASTLHILAAQKEIVNRLDVLEKSQQKSREDHAREFEEVKRRIASLEAALADSGKLSESSRAPIDGSAGSFAGNSVEDLAGGAQVKLESEAVDCEGINMPDFAGSTSDSADLGNSVPPEIVKVESLDAEDTPEPNMPPINSQKEKRFVIWTGILKWSHKFPNSKVFQKHVGQISCYVSANAKDGEPEMTGHTWPPKVLLQLVPKLLIESIGGAYLKNSKSVRFHPCSCEALSSLTKIMKSGFAGCVHFLPSRSHSCEIKALMLFYIPEEQAYLGFIPDDQLGFVERLRELIMRNNRMLPLTPVTTIDYPGPTQSTPAVEVLYDDFLAQENSRRKNNIVIKGVSLPTKTLRVDTINLLNSQFNYFGAVLETKPMGMIEGGVASMVVVTLESWEAKQRILRKKEALVNRQRIYVESEMEEGNAGFRSGGSGAQRGEGQNGKFQRVVVKDRWFKWSDTPRDVSQGCRDNGKARVIGEVDLSS